MERMAKAAIWVGYLAVGSQVARARRRDHVTGQTRTGQTSRQTALQHGIAGTLIAAAAAARPERDMQPLRRPHPVFQVRHWHEICTEGSCSTFTRRGCKEQAGHFKGGCPAEWGKKSKPLPGYDKECVGTNNGWYKGVPKRRTYAKRMEFLKQVEGLGQISSWQRYAGQHSGHCGV